VEAVVVCWICLASCSSLLLPLEQDQGKAVVTKMYKEYISRRIVIGLRFLCMQEEFESVNPHH